jgi:hypothetical protein
MELSVKKEGNGQMKLRTIFWKNGSCGTEHKVSVVGTPPPFPNSLLFVFHE